jgi:glycine/D-amino acid oxidase-like deaminating enzyme
VRSPFGVWETTAPAAPATPMLDDVRDAEIAIVGAGYTGLSTALHLAERGQTAVVIEAEEPGFGASGRNTGWLEPNWWTKQPRDIVALHGPERAARLSRWVANGPQRLAEWEARYAMRLQRDQTGLLLATAEPKRAESLATEAADWQALGVRNEYLEGAALERHVALPSHEYRGALLLRDGATLNPLALARELARACIERGVALHARTPAISIAREAERWTVRTPQGGVRCRRLVLATDAYTRTLWPALTGAFATWHAAVIASEPYPELRSLLHGGHAFADLGLANIFTLRGTPDDRIVTSTFAPLRRALTPGAVARPFMRRFERAFPGRRPPRWEYAHAGEIGLSADMLPRLVRIGPDAWSAYGYSGTGINFALLLGGELARLASGEDEREGLFPVGTLEPLTLRRSIGAALRYVHAPLARHVVSRFA